MQLQKLSNISRCESFMIERKIIDGQIVWIIKINNDFSEDKTLLISKVSEAILPNTSGNHIGDGADMDTFLQKQKGVRFIINGGFSHYRKNFYDWTHQDFNVGDPVGLVKIREHFFEDHLGCNDYGFFVQRNKGLPWEIVTSSEKDMKYILGCTPLMIHDSVALALNCDAMLPVEAGKINPPSFLGHGLEKHPRTAVGMKDNFIYFIVVEGKHGGCTLPELQNIGLGLHLDSLLNLDGGGSTQFRFLDGSQWIKNHVNVQDEKRVLGHVLVLFDEQLK